MLAGEEPRRIPLLREGLNRYQFDGEQLHRFGIAPAQLPEGSLILNQRYGSQRQVLVLSSYDPDMHWEQQIDEGLRSQLDGEEDVRLVHDYLDVRRNIMPEYIQGLYELYRLKYGHKHFDAVVAIDDAAYAFAHTYQQQLFLGAPLVFCGVNDMEAVRQLRLGEKVTGVVENIDIRGTLETALAVQPQTRRVVVIQDTSALSKLHRQQLEAEWPAVAGRLEKVYLDDLNMWELQERVASLRPDDIILLLTFSQDRSNNVFTLEESCRLLAARASVPIYTPWDFYLGYGAVGGKVVRGSEHGQLTAQLVRRVLRGERAGSMPPVWDSPSRNVFDAQMLSQFGIDEARLPAGSVVLNRPPSFYEVHRHLVWAAGATLTVLLAVILVLYVNIRRRQRAQERLSVQAGIDQLTDVFNRRRGMEELEALLSFATLRGLRLTLLFVDANDLKGINDQHGHEAGDEAIVCAAEVLRSCLRRGDVLCRFGGDEFLVLLGDCGLAQAEHFWRRVEVELAQRNRQRPPGLAISLSRGMAEFDPQQPLSLRQLIQLADERMYAYKRWWKEERQAHSAASP